MQLVGATRAFIRWPFLAKSTLHGVLGGLFTIMLLLGLLYFIQKEFIEIFSFRDADIIAILFAGIIFMGIVLNWISTYFAVNKYLRMEEDELF
jgi:cell division transport system permease protein